MKSTTHLGDITITHNHGQYVLKDARWEPYPLGKEHYNESGNNGRIIGTVVSGGVTNRLLWASSYTPAEIGSELTLDYCPVDRIYPRHDNPSMLTINIITCG